MITATRPRVTSSSNPIRVDYLPAASIGTTGRLGMTFTPGKQDPMGLLAHHVRDLDADLRRLRHVFGVHRLVLLLEPHEFAMLGVADLPERASTHGIDTVRFPIRDVSIPTASKAFGRLITRVVTELREGRSIVVACRGGRGRTGLVAASALVALGRAAEDAIAVVRLTRPGTIETLEQEAFVRRFRRRRRSTPPQRTKPTVAPCRPP